METHIFGIPVSISYWHILILLLFWLDGGAYVKKMYEKANRNGYVLAGLMCLAFVFVGLLAHEMAHGVISTAFGYPIVRAGLTGFGAFVSSDISPAELPPIEEFLITIAGPITNLLFAGLLIIPVKLLGESLHENAMQYGAFINYRIALLNMIPFMGLDGSWVLHSFMRSVGIESDAAWGVIKYISYLILAYIVYRILTKKPRKKGESTPTEEFFEKL